MWRKGKDMGACVRGLQGMEGGRVWVARGGDLGIRRKEEGGKVDKGNKRGKT